MELNYNEYLSALQNIDTPHSSSWDGDLFLPPCNCTSPLLKSLNKPKYCIEVSSSTTYDYSSTNDINHMKLTNLINYIIPGSTSRTQCGYWLCHKYSLDNLPTESKTQMQHLANTNTKKFMNTKEFSKCLELLRSDLNVLSPLNKCKLTMRRNKITRNHIKYIIQCAQSHVYQARTTSFSSIKPTSTKPRNGETSKPTSNAQRCGFNVNLFFDLKSLRWFMKVSNNITHSFHHPTGTQHFKLQQKHLTKSMNNELNKLNNGNTSTTTQANIIMANNDAVLSRHIVYNKKRAQQEEELNGMTDCEQLLHALQSKEDITHFSLFGESINSDLLTIPIVKHARQVISNQKHANVLLSTLPPMHSTDVNSKSHSSQSIKPSAVQSSQVNSKSQSTQLPLLQQIYTEKRDKLGKAHRSNLVGTQSRTLYQSDGSDYSHTIPSFSIQPKLLQDKNLQISGIITTADSIHSCVPTKQMFKTSLDSAERKLLRDIIVKEKDGMYDKTGEVKVLLACGWSQNDDIAVLRKFPEVLHMDSTFKTNKESRPLFNIVVKDANNQLRTVFRCLLPSEKQCMFDTILCSVLPNLLGKETCRRVQYIVTDGDSQEINAVRNACKTVFPNANQNTCLWHMIILGVNAKSKITNDRLRKVIRAWLWYTATNSETHDERKALIAHLKVC